MENEYGVKLDRNGYAPSIIPDHGPQQCWACDRNGASDPLNRHEVFGGAFRDKSKRLGLWVHLCHESCHQGPDGVHQNPNGSTARLLKWEAQRCCMKEYGWTVERFVAEFGKNYMEV